MESHVNIALAKEKKLIIANDDTKYHELRKKYKYLLEYYLNTLIDFRSYERRIENCDLYIGKNTKYRSLNTYLDLDFIFLINNLYIEKLSNEDITILENFDNIISQEPIDMVKRTFKEVIKDNYLKGEYQDNVYKVCYGYSVPTNFVNNNSLVFKFYYGKNLKEILDTKEFIILDKKQVAFINELMDNLTKEIKAKVGVECTFLLEKDIY